MATSNVTNRLINATQRAFSELGDGYGLAEGAASMGAGFGVVSGIDRRHGGEAYVNQLVIGNNGGPGAPTCDGWVTYCMPDAAASVMVDSAEIIEQKYPLVIRSLRLIADSGGAGRFRGGPAGEIVYGPLHDPMTVAYFAEMHEDPPQGARGGASGQASVVAKINRNGVEEPLPPIGLVDLQPGEWIRGREAGGGGYGNPLERTPGRVLGDVVEGWVSEARARDTYGVVISKAGAGPGLAVDQSATTRLRRDLAAQR
jgi:N-methylhydantoinase B